MLIRVLDTETTGFPPHAGIMELGWTDVIYTNKDTIAISDPKACFTNPGIPCEHAARGVHHIKDSDIEGCPHPNKVLEELFQGVDVICAHNSKFERQFMDPKDQDGNPIPWICTFKAALRLCPKSPDHKNQTIRYFLNLQLGNEELALPPHRAGPDTYVTAHTLAKFLSAVPPSVLIDWELEPPHFPYCPIGKERGKPWAEVDSGFLSWMCFKAPTLEEDIKFNAMKEWNRRRGV